MKKYLDLTDGKLKRAYSKGFRLVKINLKKIQIAGMILMVINLVIPFTFWPVTNPIIYKFMVSR